MSTDVQSFATWLEKAHVSQQHLSAAQLQMLQMAFQFRQRCGCDYYSSRLLSHVLLHCDSGLKVAQIGRLLGISRSAASAQQGLSSKEVVQAAHHRLTGRKRGKLLPRFAGPIAQFLHEHPDGTRWDLVDFIQRTWGVSVSRMALHRFLKKYGLNCARRLDVEPASAAAAGDRDSSDGVTERGSAPPTTTAAVVPDTVVPPTASGPPATGALVPRPPADFFLQLPTTPAPSCSCPRPSTGSPPPRNASRTPTVPCSADC
jgi:transposase